MMEAKDRSFKVSAWKLVSTLQPFCTSVFPIASALRPLLTLMGYHEVAMPALFASMLLFNAMPALFASMMWHTNQCNACIVCFNGATYFSMQERITGAHAVLLHHVWKLHVYVPLQVTSNMALKFTAGLEACVWTIISAITPSACSSSQEQVLVSFDLATAWTAMAQHKSQWVW
jgi:hypothetical protein